MKDYPSVTIYGPRQCGKTTTVRELFPEFSYANLEDIGISAKRMLKTVGIASSGLIVLIAEHIQEETEYSTSLLHASIILLLQKKSNENSRSIEENRNEP